MRVLLLLVATLLLCSTLSAACPSGCVGQGCNAGQQHCKCAYLVDSYCNASTKCPVGGQETDKYEIDDLCTGGYRYEWVLTSICCWGAAPIHQPSRNPVPFAINLNLEGPRGAGACGLSASVKPPSEDWSTSI